MEAKNEDFRSHYGASPLTLASQWFDLTKTDIPEAQLTAKEESTKGFKMFLIAHFFLWNYPKNSKVLKTRFKICDRYARGEPLWKWIRKISALKAKVIVWKPRTTRGTNDRTIYSITVDGTDCRVWEKKHPLLNQDKKQFSKKFNHGALKYEIALSVFENKCVWISGPHRGGEHDMTIFRQELKQKIEPHQKVIADRGYISTLDDEKMLSTPNPFDDKELSNFKSRARLRQETFNGRLKNYTILDATFRHGEAKHKIAMVAVCVTVQYEMDNGSPLFDP